MPAFVWGQLVQLCAALSFRGTSKGCFQPDAESARSLYQLGRWLDVHELFSAHEHTKADRDVTIRALGLPSSSHKVSMHLTSMRHAQRTGRHRKRNTLQVSIFVRLVDQRSSSQQRLGRQVHSPSVRRGRLPELEPAATAAIRSALRR